MGVKYAEATHRRFAPEKLKEGRNVIGLQVSFTLPPSPSRIHQQASLCGLGRVHWEDQVSRECIKRITTKTVVIVIPMKDG